MLWSGIGFVIDPITKGHSNRQNSTHATMQMVHVTGRKCKKERERVPHMKSVVTLWKPLAIALNSTPSKLTSSG